MVMSTFEVTRLRTKLEARIHRHFVLNVFVRSGMLLLVVGGIVAAQSESSRIPKAWDEKALKDWATPIADLNVRPGHMSAAKYYALPVDNLKTYPVYLEGKEPPGYWEFLNQVGPQPMIEPAKLKTESDWIEAGRIVFEEMDHIHLRTFNPKFIAVARRGHSAFARQDGTAANLRWVPTKDGVALSFPNCSNCHVLQLRDGTDVPGARGLQSHIRAPDRLDQVL